MLVFGDVPRVVEVALRSDGCAERPFVDPHYVVTYVLGGAIRYRIEDRLYHLREGALVLKHPYRLHLVQPASEAFGKINVHFEVMAPLRLAPRFDGVVVLPAHQQTQARTLSERAHELWTGDRPARETALSGIVQELIALLVDASDQAAPHVLSRSPEWPRVEAAVAYMRRQLREPLTVRGIANHIGLSESRFAHIFSQLIGTTVTRYLTQLRVDVAKHLLLSGRQSTAVIASAVGLGDAQRLNKAFRRVVGVAPSVWRAQRMGAADHSDRAVHSTDTS